jgi:hypothetical protein
MHALNVATSPLRALIADLTALPGYDGPDAWIPVEAVHRALWRLLYAHESDVGAPAVEALHATLTAAYALVGGHIARQDGYHEEDVARAVALFG